MSLISLAAAVTWLPITIVWAGNMMVGFGGGNGLEWAIFTFGIIGMVFCVLIWALAVGIFYL